VLGISAIADLATGEQQAKVTHEQVLAVTRRLEPQFVNLMRRIVHRLPR
jgi:purine nucleoside phosphorylase